MAVADVAFKALTAGLGVATLYLAGTFSVNVYRGLSWHSEQSKWFIKLFIGFNVADEVLRAKMMITRS
uniref:Uncharacterized protein n=1 Tax=Oryza sativa subsp. japonica TaxID=39947 RepID=Q10BB2_ORYSJ|nr:hypothetical protein LOC_Os03g60950 [Oryza sativa Japonica Group]